MEPLKLKTSPVRTLYLLLGSAAFVAAGVLLLHTSAPYILRELAGWSGIGFFGLGVIVFTINLLPNASYLQLTTQGLEVRNLFRSSFYRWRDVERFGLYQGPKRTHRNKVMVDLATSNGETPRLRAMRSWARNRCGYDGTLPDTYGMKAEDLVRLLEDRRQRAA